MLFYFLKFLYFLAFDSVVGEVFEKFFILFSSFLGVFRVRADILAQILVMVADGFDNIVKE